MSRLFHNVPALAVIALLAMGGAAASAADSRDGVFIHISHGPEDPPRLWMGLQMAGMMADDHPVLVYFDIKAVEAVLRDARDVQYAHFPSLKTQLAELAKQGVTLMACPGCLKAAGKSPAELAPGVQVADKAKTFHFTSGRILTLDC